MGVGIMGWAVDIYILMQRDFVYLSWEESGRNKNLVFGEDKWGTVGVRTSVGVYKNSYGDLVMERSGSFYWEVKILKGNYFKIGIVKQSEIPSVKKAFSDLKDGYAFYSAGKLRNGSNSEGADFKRGYGPGDTVKVRFEPREGRLSFALNDEPLEEAFCLPELKKGGYVAAVAALIEGSRFSFTLPDLED